MLDAEKETEVETVNEQEAIQIIKHKIGRFQNDVINDALDVAIKALEEVQQYRAIGTVEECRENKEFLDFLYNRINPNDMEQYLSMYNCSDEKIN